MIHVANLDALLIKKKWLDVNEKVILTDERIGHIIDGHREDYETYGSFIGNAIEKPMFILVDAKMKTLRCISEKLMIQA